MLKKLALMAILMSSGSIAFSQQSPDEVTNKRINHFVGVQANQLLKQLFSTGSSPNVNNPFLVKYALRFNESNQEITAGLGVQTSYSKGANDRETSNLDLSFRGGYSKKIMISKRFEIGAGLDLAYFNNKSESKSSNTVSGGTLVDSVYSTTTRKVTSFGGGPQLNLAFYINERIKLGTEATYYFLYRENKFDSKSERFRNGSPVSVIENNTREFGNSFSLTVPVALFVSVRF